MNAFLRYSCIATFTSILMGTSAMAQKPAQNPGDTTPNGQMMFLIIWIKTGMATLAGKNLTKPVKNAKTVNNKVADNKANLVITAPITKNKATTGRGMVNIMGNASVG